MLSHRIPYITPTMYRELPDQTTEILNRLIDEVNERELSIVELTNEIIAIKRQLAENQPTPPTPQGDWQQVLPFNPSLMGTTPGMCLQNCRLGFNIQTGTYQSAYDDMLAQKNGGTLHEELYPPANVQVPIYIRTGAAGQHVVVWDQGTVYSDGAIVQNWVDYYGAQNVYGWGELCDGVRVVSPIS